MKCSLKSLLNTLVFYHNEQLDEGINAILINVEKRRSSVLVNFVKAITSIKDNLLNAGLFYYAPLVMRTVLLILKELSLLVERVFIGVLCRLESKLLEDKLRLIVFV